MLFNSATIRSYQSVSTSETRKCIACSPLKLTLPSLSRCNPWHLAASSNPHFSTKNPAMLVFNDVLTGDELCSDAYDPKLVDDVVYEIDCQMMIIKDGEVNIGEFEAMACKANPSRLPDETRKETGCTDQNVERQVPTLLLKRPLRSSKRAPSPSSTLSVFASASTCGAVKDFENGRADDIRCIASAGPLFPTTVDAIRQEVIPHLPQGLHEGHQGLPR